MGTEIIIGILIVIIFIALRSSVKHLKGQGGCCGGGDAPKKVKKQKLETIAFVKRIKVDGMTCDHCKKRVENALNSIHQVNAKVDLSAGEAVVKLGEAVSEDRLREAIEHEGYRVVSITDEK